MEFSPIVRIIPPRSLPAFAMFLPSFTFHSPEALVLLLALPIVWWGIWRHTSHGIVTPFMADFVQIFGKGIFPRIASITLSSLVLILLAILLAGPLVVSERTNETKQGIDISIVLDISKSMLAEDMHPNRIEAAKTVIGQFLAKRDSDRVGLVLFAGRSFIAMPLTFDYDALIEATSHISTDSINQRIPGLSGTAIGDGILHGIRVLLPEKVPADATLDTERERAIILITDGEANLGVHPNMAAKFAQEKGIRIYTIGIGDPKGTELSITRPDGGREYFRDGSGQPIIAKLDETMLRSIADTTHGKYFNASDNRALTDIFDTLSALATSRIVSHTTHEVSTLSYPVCIALLIVIVLYIIHSRRWYRERILPNAWRNYRISMPRYALRFFAFSIAIVCSILVFMDGTIADITPDRSTPVLFVLDVSRSMDVTDIGDSISRLDAAKAFIRDTIHHTPANRYGLIVFAGESTIVSPFTTDTETLESFLSSVDTHTVSEQGTDMDGMIRAIIDRFDTRTGSGVAVILSDGGDTEDTPSEDTITTLSQSHIPIETIGIATEHGGYIPAGTDPFGQRIYETQNGERVISRLNTRTLQAIADRSGGTYQTYTRGTILDGFLGISGGTTLAGMDTSYFSWYRISWYLLCIAYFSFLFGCLLSEKIPHASPSLAR